MRGLGSALVSLVDLDAGQAAADRQAEHLPVTLPGRERLRTGVALAELLGAERVQDAADNAEPAPRGLSGDWVRGFRRGATQDRQSLRRRLPQHRLLACSCNIGHEARVLVIVGGGRRANPLDAESPFRELSVHRAIPGRMNTMPR